MLTDRQLVDGFLYSASMLYLPTTYRASALANMEVLRRARGYRTRWYLSPEDLEEPVPAYSQLEYQIRCKRGAMCGGLHSQLRLATGGECLLVDLRAGDRRLHGDSILLRLHKRGAV